MLALLLVAASVGLSNFAAAVSMGTGGVDRRTRWRVGLVFGVFESGMPVLGLLIGAHVAGLLGHAGRWIGGALLIAVGIYGLIPRRGERAADGGNAAAIPASWVRLLASGLALSLDNLVVGFALGTYQVGIVAGAIVIGAVSVAMSLAGLELGARLGGWAGRLRRGRQGGWAARLGWAERDGRAGEQLGGVILVVVGTAIAAGALS
ncbi:MAG TPA: manganese efflux pump [Streptosporangiaceae bacterium]|jgi:putative Mn2+ efflux pump MntP